MAREAMAMATAVRSPKQKRFCIEANVQMMNPVESTGEVKRSAWPAAGAFPIIPAHLPELVAIEHREFASCPSSPLGT